MVEALVRNASRATPSTDGNRVVASRLDFTTRLTRPGLTIAAIQVSVLAT